MGLVFSSVLGGVSQFVLFLGFMFKVFVVKEERFLGVGCVRELVGCLSYYQRLYRIWIFIFILGTRRYMVGVYFMVFIVIRDVTFFVVVSLDRQVYIIFGVLFYFQFLQFSWGYYLGRKQQCSGFSFRRCGGVVIVCYLWLVLIKISDLWSYFLGNLFRVWILFGL